MKNLTRRDLQLVHSIESPCWSPTSPASSIYRVTHLQNCRILWSLTCCSGRLRGALFDPEIFHIASSEDDVLEHIIARRDFECWISFAAYTDETCPHGILRDESTLCTERADLFEGNCRVDRIDFMQDTDISDVRL